MSSSTPPLSFSGLFGSSRSPAKTPRVAGGDLGRCPSGIFGDPEDCCPTNLEESSTDSIAIKQRQNSPNSRSFAAFAAAGMSPCLGVPPLECVVMTKNQTPEKTSNNSPRSSNVATAPGRIRKRHFSLEDYNDEFLDESSSSSECSTNSFLAGGGQQLQQLNSCSNSYDSYSSWIAPGQAKGNNIDDLKTPLSFIHDLSYGDDALLHLGPEVSQSTKCDLESRLWSALMSGFTGNSDQHRQPVTVDLPQGLLGVIANHVLQEAAAEPYGIKGCLLHLQYEGETALHPLGSLDLDGGNANKTFELTLTLREGQTTWGQRMARRLSFSSSLPLQVSTSYKLVKKRKYRG